MVGLDLRLLLTYIRDILYPFFYYARYIETHRLVYGTNILCPWVPRKIRLAWWIKVANLLSFPFGLACWAMLAIRGLERYSPFDVFYVLVPPFGGHHHQWITLGMWNAMRLIFLTWCLTDDLPDYRFMAVFLVREERRQGDQNQICPRDLGLTDKQYEQLHRMRRRTMRTMYWIVFIIFLLTSYSRFKQFLKSGMWSRQFALSLFWYSNYLVMVGFTAPFNYGLPAFIAVVVYYLYLKQVAIYQEMDSLNRDITQCRHSGRPMRIVDRFRAQFNRRYEEINRKYAHLYRETESYNRFLQRSLTILLGGWTAIITYCIYIIFLTKVPLPLKALYTFLFATHIIDLLMVVVVCAMIANVNQELGKRMHRFRVTAARLYSIKSLIHFESIAENLVQQPSCFTLLTEAKMNSRILFTMLFNVSSLFFLVFSN